MYLKVFVTPDSKRENVEKIGDVYKITVREPAAQNRANTRVRELVARKFAVPVGKVAILTGHRARGKMISIST